MGFSGRAFTYHTLDSISSREIIQRNKWRQQGAQEVLVNEKLYSKITIFKIMREHLKDNS